MSLDTLCSKCGRERSNYIADPTCLKGGYCDWSLRVVCLYCDKGVHDAEIKTHAVECAHERIEKLEKTVKALSCQMDLLAGILVDAGIIEEFRP